MRIRAASAGEHVEVAEHERGDLGDHAAGSAAGQAEQQVARRGGRGEQQRDEHAEGALGDDVPGAVEPVDGQRRARASGPARRGRGTAARTRTAMNGSSIRERGASQPRPTRATRATTTATAQRSRRTPRTPRAASHDHDDREEHAGGDLHLGRAAGAPASRRCTYSAWAWPAPMSGRRRCSARAPLPAGDAGAARRRRRRCANVTSDPDHPGQAGGQVARCRCRCSP